MACPVCDDKGVTHHHLHDAVWETRPCPRCRPAAPGRLLKAVPDQTLGAEEIARELSEELHP